MTFRIHALSAQDFAPFFAMTEAKLTAANAMRVIVDSEPGYPCRVSLEDATALRMRTQSVRAFDDNWMLVDADLAEGEAEIAATIEKLLKRPEVKEVHLHNARQGCYAARATRA